MNEQNEKTDSNEPPPPSGWFGEEEELLHTLRTCGAETDENGSIKIFNEPMCQGIDGSVVVHQLTECLIKGKRTNVAGLMKETSYGMAVIVM